ncbi:ABC transporter ATP-binding protein [Corynebacterium crudilactis]|uniref:ABC transporter ATP-binding protein n=1 Tax=Corynebacterium crudilactis TaxID=1652495 RepID=A0A172QTE5_9CORY|nr:ATP-binding cassette domain-containing protein [Corynebacterium crudilactis]ANE03963.1 ABC transporter ATP-binding protein [Corynebacterium crudilactis]
MLSICAKIGYSTPIAELELNFNKGKIYGICGANGAGKSTLLRTLAGELYPLEGTVKIGDVSVTDLKSVGKIITISTPDFYPDVSIGEHFKILSKTGKVNFADSIQRWNLEELLRKSPNKVSSGQQQRSFLALQLEIHSEVVVLDEPERHLDAFWIDILAQELKKKATNGTAVILASHSQDILNICDEVIHLEKYDIAS